MDTHAIMTVAALIGLAFWVGYRSGRAAAQQRIWELYRAQHPTTPGTDRDDPGEALLAAALYTSHKEVMKGLLPVD